MKKITIILFASIAVISFTACKSKKKARVYFIEPKNGAVVTSPVHIKMGAENIAVEPAGEVKENSGHHHIIINGGPVPKGQVIPKDDTHLHFGKGQTETDLDLKPGKYKLTLQFADGAHKSYGKELSDTIEITVKEKE
ncbi:MAG: DUF4399 domain-containing protein [Candidatus Hydrogenedentota bacterium]|nr:MAG: DUF4399 domain-containing protein [Candidatus Hydrogenedentota bacterium]